ncbi:matrixin family metalloprotease [Nocardioides sp. InS609-2]|uniref:matrixin family metalloprotease n=1 Tax=Nocardioides sp. InS609-2 TaxID=2760705 RepID=UPI002097DB07|nr:matrixin family metalloprotease [Nocardioides sp. InS609-2]
MDDTSSKRPRHIRRWLDPVLVVLVMWPVVQLMGATAQSPSPQVDACRWQGDIPIEVLQATTDPSCSLVGRVVYAGNAAVTIPPAGMGVGAAAARDKTGGDALDFTVSTSLSGVVTAEVEELEPVVAARQQRNADACKDAQFNSGGHAWAAPLTWTFDASSTPRHLNKSRALRDLVAGAKNIAGGRNDCGLARVSTVGSSYAGVSSTRPDIDVIGNNITCGDYNTSNAVDFGALPRGIYGWTCFWWDSTGQMVAADMRVSNSPAVVTKVPHRCRSRFDLQAIATHEWGHAFGLGHVSAANRNLTMPPLLISCSSDQRTLGLGDYKGIEALYAPQ